MNGTDWYLELRSYITLHRFRHKANLTLQLIQDHHHTAWEIFVRIKNLVDNVALLGYRYWIINRHVFKQIEHFLAPSNDNRTICEKSH